MNVLFIMIFFFLYQQGSSPVSALILIKYLCSFTCSTWLGLQREQSGQTQKNFKYSGFIMNFLLFPLLLCRLGKIVLQKVTVVPFYYFYLLLISVYSVLSSVAYVIW